MDIRSEVIKLNEQRLSAWEEGKRLLEDTRGDFSAEQQAEWDRINGAINDLDKRRDNLLAAERRESEAAQIREANNAVFGEARVERKEQSEADVLRAFLTNRNAAPLEFDMGRAAAERRYLRDGMDAREARALAWDTGSIASGVPTVTASTLYGYLEASIAAFRMPTTKINTASGEVMYFPTVAAHAIGTQVSGQGTALAGTDPTFSRMQLDAYKYGELVVVASEVVSDTGFDVVGFVARDVARALGRVIDTDLITGSGTGKPKGIITAYTGSGTITTGGSLITPTYEKLIDLVYSVNDEYRSGGSAAWLMRDATAGVLRKLRDGGGGTVGAVLWDPSLTAGIQGGQPDRLLGYPVYTDPNVASLASNARIAAFGDFSSYYIRQVGNLVFDRDDSRYFDTDQVGFRGKWRVDGDTIDATAVNVLNQNV
jgi:HK97 family phage major capsid protein